MGVICDQNAAVVHIVCARYSLEDKDTPAHSLQPILDRWRGEGIHSEIARFTDILQSGNITRLRQEKMDQAAATIQAAWRSYYTRSRPKRADNAFKKFQRSFRLK